VAAFTQWFRGSNQVRRITWVCGPELVLQDEVIAAQLAAVPLLGVIRLTAGEVPERDIWDCCSFPGEDRLVLIRDADRLKDPARIIPLTGAARDISMLVFASNEDDFPKGKGGLAPYLAAIRDCRYAQMIRCTKPRDDDLLDWTVSRWPGLGRNDAWRLAVRAGGDLAAIRDAGAKAQAAGLLDAKHIGTLCDLFPGEEMAELLVAGNKPGALAAAAGTSRSAIGAALALLSSRLGTLCAIREGQQRQLDTRAICSRLGVSQFLLARYRDVAAAYPPARVRQCREILAQADSAWRSGAETGIAETVIANW
jgi:hypothetical protein